MARGNKFKPSTATPSRPDGPAGGEVTKGGGTASTCLVPAQLRGEEADEAISAVPSGKVRRAGQDGGLMQAVEPSRENQYGAGPGLEDVIDLGQPPTAFLAYTPGLAGSEKHKPASKPAKTSTLQRLQRRRAKMASSKASTANEPSFSQTGSVLSAKVTNASAPVQCTVTAPPSTGAQHHPMLLLSCCKHSIPQLS